MTHFTPAAALVGGALIGLSAVLLWIGNGRIAGISGILGRPVSGSPANSAEWPWRLAFLAGLITAPRIYAMAVGSMPRILLALHPALLVAAGLLVGFGTRLGSGCTSGHGVCGLARLSPRSMTATALFLATALLTVFLLHHVLGA